LLINSYKLGKTVILLQLLITQYLTIGRRYRLTASIEFVN